MALLSYLTSDNNDNQSSCRDKSLAQDVLEVDLFVLVLVLVS